MKLIEIEQRIGLSKIIPSCNDCANTIVTKQFKRTRKGVETTCPAFRKEIRTLLLRITESGRVSGNNLFYKLLASLRCPELNYLHPNSFSDYAKLGVEGKG